MGPLYGSSSAIGALRAWRLLGQSRACTEHRGCSLISSSHHSNWLPSSAMARLDFRLVPDLTSKIVVDLLREHLDVRGFKDIEIIELGNAPLAKSSAKSDIARAVIDSTAEVYGLTPLIYPMDPSSGPVGAVCGVNNPPTPVVSFGTSYAGSNPHGPDENIRIDDFLLTIKLLGRVIHRLAEGSTKPLLHITDSSESKPTAPLPRPKHSEKR
jgi:acetylornithine deacetylase/succinyl-diaminopimelate desuccinylase-like protein